MPRVLVTGANGFVGAALCRKLLQSGHTVRAAIRTSSSIDIATNAGSISDRGYESVVVGDIGPNTDWRAALRDVDTIVHLAARVHVVNETGDNPLATFRQVNTLGTACLAQMAIPAGVRRLVYISSIKVNGEQKQGAPFTEQDAVAPQGPYAISKCEAEQELHKIASKTGLDVVLIRPPLIYGPGVKANFLQLMKWVARGVPFPLASIDNRRSLIYLGNLVDAIVTCATHPKAAGQTFLVSDGEDISTPELIRRIANSLGKPRRLLPFPPSLMRFAGKITNKSATVDRLLGFLVIDSSKLRHELDWTPPYSMTRGLKETADWYNGLFPPR